jgi:hypothetical protein
MTNNITAECVAEYTKRPLMMLSSSDIGTNPVQVENTLKMHFRHAKSWDAILLIDEADVFLEKRATADLIRNSLVAGMVFERIPHTMRCLHSAQDFYAP